MNPDPPKTTHGSRGGPEALFWESQAYTRAYFSRLKRGAFRYYDNFSALNFLFFRWISRWLVLLSEQYVEPYRLHPLPLADQALRWQPVFSKHISDGLVRLVLYRHFYRMIVVDEPPEDDIEDKTTIKNDDLDVPIYELLKKYFSHCTTFVTAHDANVLQICSSVWVIHDGCLVRTCRTSDIAANESIANIIEESVT